MSPLTSLREDLEQWRERYAATPERDALFTTLSGEPIEPLYTEDDQFTNPPRCRFGFGAGGAGSTARVIDCVVSELSITELQFNARLAPMRADVALTLTEISVAGSVS